MHQVEENYVPEKLETSVRKAWDQGRVYAKVKRSREGGRPYYFLDGPPYTTGSIHLGTAWNKILKDTIVRYRRMRGFHVRDQPGFDMHGLPIEVRVEQSIGIRTKKDIESYGVDKFVATCREFALTSKDKMTEGFKSLGVWLDWERPYLTVDRDYMLSAWWTVKRAHEQGLLEKAQRVLSWCPRCETALAEAEVEYWDEEDPSVYIRFQLDGGKESMLVWTTTPWTLPGNLAVMVHPEFTYAKVKFVRSSGTEVAYLLRERVGDLAKSLPQTGVEILKELKGSDLLKLRYRHPLLEEVPYQQTAEGEWVHRVVPAESVTTEHTGLVHAAPGHGPEDFVIGQKHGLKPFCPVDGAGRFTEEAGKWLAGRAVREANSEIVATLERKGLLFFKELVKHRYGHCWRCKTPIVYRATEQWFLKVTQLKDKLLELNRQVRWVPDWAGSNREADWIKNARDWCLSRQRYWGTALPIWECECGHRIVVGSEEDLKAAKGYSAGMDLHRPAIDAVTFTCPKCRKEVRRVPDTLDVWFDSGVAGWASLGYPHRRDEFDRWFPSQWITEAEDQTRGWFYTQLVTGFVAFGQSPFKSVLMHGWAQDPKGRAFSKSEGEAISPEAIIQAYGADALRLYYLRSAAPWEDNAFQSDGVKAMSRLLNVLWNTYKFAALYMSLDGFEPESTSLASLEAKLRPEDRWLLSRTQRMVREASEAMEAYELHRAVRAIETFVGDDLSRWYVKLVRDRTWKEAGDADKLAAYKVLHEALLKATLVLAPLAPHISEALYENLEGKYESVHALDWPQVDERWIDEELEAAMALVQGVSERVAKARADAGVKLRWPLKRFVIKPQDEASLAAFAQLKDVLQAQTNVKEVDLVPIGEEWEDMVLTVIPNPHAIGKVYRQWSSKIAVLLKNRPAKTIKAGIDKGEYELGIEGQLVTILPNMVSFSSALPPDVVTAEFSRGVLYIDFERSPTLEAEGNAREAIRRIQQMRKDMKLNVQEFIRVQISCSAKLREQLEEWSSHISEEVRSRGLEFTSQPKGDYIVEWGLGEEETLTLALSSLHLMEGVEAITKIPGIGVEKAMQLHDAGYATIEALQAAAPETLAKVPGITRADVKRVAEYLARQAVPVPVARAPAAAPAEAQAGRFVSALASLPSMDQAKAIALYEAGYTSSDALLGARLSDLMKVRGIDEKSAAALVAQFGPRAPAPAAPAPPAALPAAPKRIVSLEKSFAYLVKEERSENAYALFLDALRRGMRGYCVTRNYPAKIKSKFDLGDTPVVWLSNVGRESAIRPKDLEKLSLSLEQFLSADKSGGIILLDGLEYLITNNNFITILRLIQSLRDQVAINQSILLMAVNPSTLESHQLNLLEREVDSTISEEGTVSAADSSPPAASG